MYVRSFSFLSCSYIPPPSSVVPPVLVGTTRLDCPLAWSNGRPVMPSCDVVRHCVGALRLSALLVLSPRSLIAAVAATLAVMVFSGLLVVQRTCLYCIGKWIPVVGHTTAIVSKILDAFRHNGFCETSTRSASPHRATSCRAS